MDSLPEAPQAPAVAPEQTPASETPMPPAAPRTSGGLARIARMARIALRIAIVLLAGLLLIYVAVWVLLFAVLALGPLGLLAYGLFLGLLVAILVPWLLVRFGRLVRRPLVSLADWIARRSSRSRASAAATAPPVPTQAPSLLEHLAQLLRIRFVWSRMAAVWVLLGLVVASALVWFSATLAFQVITGGSIEGTDLRVLNLVATLRTPELDQVMYAFTFLASVPMIVALTAVVVIIAILAHRYADALLLFLAPVAGGIFVEIVKLLVARPRPPLADARLVADGFSFPSGHATTAAVLYGTLAYVLIRALRGGHEVLLDLLRIAIGIGAALLIFAIGLSRIYLGVHYPSDVLAGWALGAIWLVLVVVAEHLWMPVKAAPLSPPRRATAIVGGVLLVAIAGVTLYALYPALPPSPAVPTSTAEVILPDGVQGVVLAQLPHVTQTIFGAPQEPISLVFVGTRAQIEQAFTTAGWTEAERPEPGNDVRALWAGITRERDPAGPVAPSFLADEPNRLAFSQEVGNSFDQRHHVRLWGTTVMTSDNQPVWLATASFDAGVGFSHENFLPTHHIAPNIDAERDYLVSALSATGDVASTSTFQLVPPESGHNFVGDPFFTDGRAVLLYFE